MNHPWVKAFATQHFDKEFPINHGIRLFEVKLKEDASQFLGFCFVHNLMKG
jgi:hypothetical protein